MRISWFSGQTIRQGILNRYPPEGTAAGGDDALRTQMDPLQSPAGLVAVDDGSHRRQRPNKVLGQLRREGQQFDGDGVKLGFGRIAEDIPQRQSVEKGIARAEKSGFHGVSWF